MLYSEYLDNRRGYQELGAMLLLERKHACLYYKPGKGKTYPCIDAMRDVDAEKHGNAKVLILSTANAIKNMWLAEIEPQNILPKNTVMMSLSAAIQEKTKANLMKIKWDIIVIDECHKIKAHNTKSSKLVYQLSKRAEYVWGLSGTPRGNCDIDIFCQFHNMCIGEWGTINYTHFVNVCCDVDKKFFAGQMITVPTGINERYKAGWERNIAMYTQRIDYDEDDAMPEFNLHEIKLDYKPTKEYLQAEQGLININDYATTLTKLSAIQKLHQAVNGFLYLTDEVENQREVWHIERNKKLDWLNENLTDEPTVIVYRFAEDLSELKHELGLTKWTEDVDEFKTGKYNVLFLQCSSCESFNLQMCRKMIFYTLDYSYIKYDQMCKRIWRMGQKEDVDVYVLLFDKTVETKIWSAVRNKEKMADLFMHIKQGV